jgi:hypothetical protein
LAKNPNTVTCDDDSDCKEGWICNADLGLCEKNQEPKGSECTGGENDPACFDASPCTLDGCDGKGSCYHIRYCEDQGLVCCANSCSGDPTREDPTCCVDTSSDINNCGGCGITCTVDSAKHVAGVDCDGGCVITSCEANWDNCDNQYSTGCETDLLPTASHCGDCDTSCPPATPACSGGNCICTLDGSVDSCSSLAATPHCDTSSGDCVECTEDNHCSDSNPCTTNEHCESNTCQRDTVSGGTECGSACCVSPTPYCIAEDTSTCGACRNNDDCIGSDPYPCTTDTCDTVTTHTCQHTPITGGTECGSACCVSPDPYCCNGACSSLKPLGSGCASGSSGDAECCSGYCSRGIPMCVLQPLHVADLALRAGDQIPHAAAAFGAVGLPRKRAQHA